MGSFFGVFVFFPAYIQEYLHGALIALHILQQGILAVDTEVVHPHERSYRFYLGDAFLDALLHVVVELPVEEPAQRLAYNPVEARRYIVVVGGILLR